MGRSPLIIRSTSANGQFNGDCNTDCACAIGDCDGDCSGDCSGDCACPAQVDLERAREEDSFSSARVQKSHKLIAVEVDDEHTVLLHQTKHLGTILINETTRQILDYFREPIYIDDLPDFPDVPRAEVLAAAHSLLEIGMLHPYGEREPNTPCVRPNTLVVWLHVTDRCNLRCSYCYLPHNPQDMTLEVGKACIEAAIRSAKSNGYSKIQLKYAGGEPLLRFSFIQAVHKYAQEIASRENIRISGVVLTNGTKLTAEIITVLKQLGLSLMVSLDGIGDVHDRQRSFVDGKGSSRVVLQAIELAKEMGLSPHISVTVTSQNVSGLSQLVSWLLKNDLSFNLNFYRENVFSQGAALAFEEEQIIDGISAAFTVIGERLPQRSLFSTLVDRSNLNFPHHYTCGVGRNYLVFDCAGNVAKCHMLQNEALASYCDADPLALVRNDELGVQNKPVDEKEGCTDCKWKYWCAGGCPLVTYNATGRYGVKSPNCEIYQALYPEAIRLEGLRMLKWEYVH